MFKIMHLHKVSMCSNLQFTSAFLHILQMQCCTESLHVACGYYWVSFEQTAQSFNLILQKGGTPLYSFIFSAPGPHSLNIWESFSTRWAVLSYYMLCHNVAYWFNYFVMWQISHDWRIEQGCIWSLLFLSHSGKTHSQLACTCGYIIKGIQRG